MGALQAAVLALAIAVTLLWRRVRSLERRELLAPPPAPPPASDDVERRVARLEAADRARTTTALLEDRR